MGGFPIQYTDYTLHYDLDAYDMPMPEDMGYFRRNLEKRRFQTIVSLVPRGGVSRVLDIGSGSGWLSEMLFRRGFSVHAVDLGFDSIKRASLRIKKNIENQHGINNTGRNNLNKFIDFTLADIYRLPYREKTFDTVVASEIIEHLDKPQQAFSEISRILRPEGYFIISTPYREIIEQTRCIHCNKKTPVNAHLHSFDTKDIEDMLNSAGFTVQKTVLFVSRPSEKLGLAGVTFFLPHVVWRLIDSVFCSVFAGQTYMIVKAKRKDM
ncbi:MAG: methyltransferase domain-containing protein [Candidatus Latescibacteria bacterium]|nr:methyltransferase domain-containing protein [Candidatus Latescibacterota bacterium]